MPVLDREEFIEQAYFFHAFRERLADGVPSQDILLRIGEELLSTTKLPMAVGFLATESKVTGLMAPAMSHLGHYFTAFQAHVIGQAEADLSRFPMEQALLVLEREVEYKMKGASLPGLFIFQFESLSRNRLGYSKGLAAMAEDPMYDEDWRDYILTLQARLGDVDFADLIFVRSAYFANERRKLKPDFVPKYPPLFGEKEGKIARANRGRDPLYLFSALQRQLGYPEVPRPKRPDGVEDRLTILEQRVAQLENRLKFVEGAGNQPLDVSQVIVKPEDTAGIPSGWAAKRLGS
ncbi:hypothetical protein [Paludisphaera mucosa]|uniref:Uncharacterized protein n=1 Tax=Paludisphaera mucosa TaxID=3030827 RepID=A0ABT6F851_9BACT|nr:hypothetical protein [Paludisphaera mucosa]MDG3003604.1 hypothetical protein [Paludisphaera mucosa]